ncbi:MAG: NAD-dependent epimerase/dehydratase family protein [Candidatus Berkiellales bacterium]
MAILFKQHQTNVEIIALDNLSRRGSELNLLRLAQHGVKFVHGDVRNPEDLARIGKVDWLIECSAEPSVHAGFGESPAYLINTNLLGLIHCLEYLRNFGGHCVFLSTSRVYPINLLRQLPLIPLTDRLSLHLQHPQIGLSIEGISESFPLTGPRSLYGATKLCGELLIQEYTMMYHLPAIINRCGVLAGPWQMGKVDQGFMALWVASHYFGMKLNYMGFGGEGMQVRDVLHVKDLFQLIHMQMQNIEDHQGAIYNVGGGMNNSISLRELTALVQEVTQKTCEIGHVPETREADIPFYVTDNTKVMQKTDWKPTTSVRESVEEIFQWCRKEEQQLKTIFCQ